MRQFPILALLFAAPGFARAEEPSYRVEISFAECSKVSDNAKPLQKPLVLTKLVMKEEKPAEFFFGDRIENAAGEKTEVGFRFKVTLGEVSHGKIRVAYNPSCVEPVKTQIALGNGKFATAFDVQSMESSTSVEFGVETKLLTEEKTVITGDRDGRTKFWLVDVKVTK